jgi:threonine dehydratase
VVIELEDIEAARERIAGAAVRTPLVRLDAPEAPAEIWLKLEVLQPIRSFKIRGAANAVRSAPAAEVQAGLVTASAGNMAQGLAWMAREIGVDATIVVPEHAPQAKLDAIARLGARALRVPYDAWWAAIRDGGVRGLDGLVVHPLEYERVMAGNGPIGLEILADLPEPAAVVMPFGGGGLTVGIASVMRALSPHTRVFSVEPEGGAALSAAIAAGRPEPIEYVPSFVDGAGSRTVLPAMWPRVASLIDGALTASVEEAAAAVRLLAARTRFIAEGAGAIAAAAALAGRAGDGPIVCVVSGGNIDLAVLGQILAGATPGR